MSPTRRASLVPLLVPAVLLLGGCSLGDLALTGTDRDDDTSGTVREGTPRQDRSQPPGPSQPDEPEAPADEPTACPEVRAGIDDFNAGAFTGTVDHFKSAVPLARKAARADGTSAARDLLDAVRYYAALPAEDYLEASATSPEFAKYKAITLGQCDSIGGSDDEGGDDGGVTI